MILQEADEELLSSIQQAIQARYQNLPDPWYGWVMPTYEAAPYKAVVDDLLSSGASVEDDTDLNNDVSCRFYVRHEGVFLVVELSLVGPFAVAVNMEMELSKPIRRDVLSPGLAVMVVQTLERHGLILLDASVLCIPIAMSFNNTDPGEGTLYQALISDTPTSFDCVESAPEHHAKF
jgi:hypothetical protein